MSDRLPIRLVIPYLNGLLHVNSTYLYKLRSDQVKKFKLENERISLIRQLRTITIDGNATYLIIQNLARIYKQIVSDAIFVFGERVFNELMTKKNFHNISPDVKKLEQQCRHIHKSRMPSIKPRNGPVNHIVTTISKWTYSCPYMNHDIRHTSKDCEPVIFGTRKTKICDPEEISKILTITSDDDTAIFEFARSNIAETLRLDIMWEKRKYEIWYKLKKLSKRIKILNEHISDEKDQYNALKTRFYSIIVSDIDPKYITTVHNKCKMLEHGIKIADDYAKISEFAQWASKYGSKNSSDLDIVDAVEWVNLHADDELNILHNKLIEVRNYCNIKNVSLCI
jgi:hypothetical protein